jgi:hypothetical protein
VNVARMTQIGAMSMGGNVSTNKVDEELYESVRMSETESGGIRSDL